MVRTKTRSEVSGRCLTFLLLLFSFSAWATPFELGQVTQVQGEVTHLTFARPHNLVAVSVKQPLLTGGSYLTQENSFLTVKLFDGSWVRLSPKSKMAPEFDPTTKTITIHLFSGSLKVLYSASLAATKSEKLVVKNADASFETTEGKFTVVRNLITDETSVHVEKGTVVAFQTLPNDQQDVEIVHASEMTYIKDRSTEIATPRKMTEKELKFLHPSFYLKGN